MVEVYAFRKGQGFGPSSVHTRSMTSNYQNQLSVELTSAAKKNQITTSKAMGAAIFGRAGTWSLFGTPLNMGMQIEVGKLFNINVSHK